MLFHLRLLSMVYCVVGVVVFDEGEVLEASSSNTKGDSFENAVVYYFAYGSNMLEKRLRIKCPDARFYGAALLKNHRLDFTMEMPWWNGAVATICNDPNTDVWGVLWIIRVIDMDKLDEQEGVSAGWYHSKEVIVECEGDRNLKAITYVQNHSPRKLNPFDNYPPERQPSLTYLKVMILGAVQGGIPDDYIQYLYSIRHNGRVASQELIDKFLHSSKNTRLLL